MSLRDVLFLGDSPWREAVTHRERGTGALRSPGSSGEGEGWPRIPPELHQYLVEGSAHEYLVIFMVI